MSKETKQNHTKSLFKKELPTTFIFSSRKTKNSSVRAKHLLPSVPSVPSPSHVPFHLDHRLHARHHDPQRALGVVGAAVFILKPWKEKKSEQRAFIEFFVVFLFFWVVFEAKVCVGRFGWCFGSILRLAARGYATEIFSLFIRVVESAGILMGQGFVSKTGSLPGSPNSHSYTVSIHPTLRNPSHPNADNQIPALLAYDCNIYRAKASMFTHGRLCFCR